MTPILLAAMGDHSALVSLLKTKYGQTEPTPEEVVRIQLTYVCMHVNLEHINTLMYMHRVTLLIY